MKPKLSQQEIKAIGAAWKATRPYNILTPTDNHYIELAKTIYLASTLSLEEERNEELGMDFHVGLAVVLTGWFEDFANEWGIWQAYTERNQELYGTYLPIIEIEDYDPEFINPADIHFLIWNYYRLYDPSMAYFPNAEFFFSLSNILVILLDEKLEDIPLSETVTQFFDMGKDEQYYEMRTRVEWLSTQTYLFGMLDYHFYIQEIKEEEDMQYLSGDMQDQMIYHSKISYLFNQITSYGQLRPIEMAARILKVTPNLRKKMETVSHMDNITATFQGKKGDHYHFTLLGSTRSFQVTTDSGSLSYPIGTNVFGSIIRWGDEIYLQGFNTQADNSPVPPEDLGLVPLPLATKAEMAALKENRKKTTQILLGAMGQPCQIVHSVKEMREFIQSLINQLSQFQIAGEWAMLDPNMADEIFRGSPVAIFQPQEGMILFSEEMAWIIKTLQNKTTFNQMDEEELYYKLTETIDLQAAKYILENYPKPRLPWTMLDMDWWDSLLMLKGLIAPGTIQSETIDSIHDTQFFQNN